MNGRTIVLFHLDHGEGEHSYALYSVDADDAGAAAAALGRAWGQYEAGDRQGYIDEIAEAELEAAGIAFEILDYVPASITT